VSKFSEARFTKLSPLVRCIECGCKLEETNNTQRAVYRDVSQPSEKHQNSIGRPTPTGRLSPVELVCFCSMNLNSPPLPPSLPSLPLHSLALALCSHLVSLYICLFLCPLLRPTPPRVTPAPPNAGIHLYQQAITVKGATFLHGKLLGKHPRDVGRDPAPQTTGILSSSSAAVLQAITCKPS
jgi:hypothetical protein